MLTENFCSFNRINRFVVSKSHMFLKILLLEFGYTIIVARQNVFCTETVTNSLQRQIRFLNISFMLRILANIFVTDKL